MHFFTKLNFLISINFSFCTHIVHFQHFLLFYPPPTWYFVIYFEFHRAFVILFDGFFSPFLILAPILLWSYSFSLFLTNLPLLILIVFSKILLIYLVCRFLLIFLMHFYQRRVLLVIIVYIFGLQLFIGGIYPISTRTYLPYSRFIKYFLAISYSVFYCCILAFLDLSAFL